MPSKRPIGMPNCLRMRAYAPVANTAERMPPEQFDGSEIARPTERHSTSMRQPCPAMSGPPISCESGTKTSLPRTGPFWNGTLSGK